MILKQAALTLTYAVLLVPAYLALKLAFETSPALTAAACCVVLGCLCCIGTRS